MFGRIGNLIYSSGWSLSLRLDIKIFWTVAFTLNDQWLHIFYFTFCVSCSANVPTVHDYEAVIVGLPITICSSKLLFYHVGSFFFSSTTNYVLWWVQQFIYVWGTKDWGNKYSSPYFTRCTIMVGWIVCCVPNQMTSNFFSRQIRYEWRTTG